MTNSDLIESVNPVYNFENLFLTDFFLHLILLKNTALKYLFFLITELVGTLFSFVLNTQLPFPTLNLCSK